MVTQKHVTEVKDMMQKVEIMAETAAADASLTCEGLATFTRLSNERIENLHEVLKAQHQSMEEMSRQIRLTSGMVHAAGI